MSIEYEHGGVTYHEPLPRLLLVGFPSAASSLMQSGYNSKLCLVRPNTFYTRFDLRPPSPPQEVDILLVRDVPYERLQAHEPGVAPTREDYPFSGRVIWPSGREELFNSFCREIVFHGGICCFFVPASHGNLLGVAKLGITPDPENKLWPGKTAHRLPTERSFEALSSFLTRWFTIPSVYVGLSAARELQIDPTNLILDLAGVPYSIAFPVSLGGPQPGLLICLPDYGDRADALDSLLSAVLPEIAPHLFPFRYDLSWLKEPEFTHPRILALQANKQAVRDEAQRKLDSLEEQIHMHEAGEQHLRDLLTAAGDPLKSAVRKTLEELFKLAGVADVTVLDVDADAALRGSSRQEREDLKIEWGETIFLLNVAGREQFFKENSINQIDRHQRLFVRDNPDVPVKNVRSLLIGNFNYAGGLDARKRGEMFGTGTAQARDRLVDAGYGAMTTFDLYRLLRAVHRNEAALRAEDLAKLLSTEGILDFEEFRTSLERPKPDSSPNPRSPAGT